MVPLSLRFADEEFLDGVTIDHKTFYEKLVECGTIGVILTVPLQAFITVLFLGRKQK